MQESESSRPVTLAVAETNPGHKIYTYHCLCMGVLLATTYPLFSLPRRAYPAKDQAYILPLSSPLLPTPREAAADKAAAIPNLHQNIGYAHSELVNVAEDRNRIIMRRDDGFEKRVLLRCGRCKVVVGYKIEPARYETAAGDSPDSGRGEEIMYVLPGSLVESEDMRAGRIPDGGE